MFAENPPLSPEEIQAIMASSLVREVPNVRSPADYPDPAVWSSLL